MRANCPTYSDLYTRGNDHPELTVRNIAFRMLMPVTVAAVSTTVALITNQDNNVGIRVISSGSLITQESVPSQIGVYVTGSGLHG